MQVLHAWVPPDELSSKITWADAEQPNHLLFIVSSHLTRGCREWLEKIKSQKPYRIHVIEGKHLVDLLVQHQDVVERHCLDRFGKLLLDSKRRWLVHDLLPDYETLALLSENIDLTRLTLADAAFLWSSAAALARHSDEEDGDQAPFSFEFLAGLLRQHANTSNFVLANYPYLELLGFQMSSNPSAEVFSEEVSARLCNVHPRGHTVVNYAFIYTAAGEGFEMCIEAAADFPTHVRHLTSNARNEANTAFAAILAKRAT